ncbi:hypothetical protein [Saccharospirillum salsuginis]|uniref:Uncharacterized protein n=1 Tax=Saccharospirillum salsuginis TaxID=418750 RepID=A0A918KT39_9GAMM|nr:hypothetical protein [Saccharospirillum salsuginis]GGX75141.1 hypothetical protein GCM10007392_47940 [Saccharospirillum salsuginis]
MNWSAWIRQGNRWLSMLFTATVIANFVTIAAGSAEPPAWVTYSPLPLLFLLLFSGLYLFALPHVTQWRGKARHSA